MSRKSYKAFTADEVLLPKREYDYTKWAVIACDQYTSQMEYWNNVKSIAGDQPSTLNLMYPESYMVNNIVSEEDATIDIIKAQKDYLNNGILEGHPSSVVFVKRTLDSGDIRKGLVFCVDLEDYSFDRSKAPGKIRPTEATLVDRLPTRVTIREQAPIELPHVLLFFNDPDNTVFSRLEDIESSLENLYDFDLMQKGGHLKGYLLNDEENLKELDSLLSKLQEDFSYAVADGNHSLAAAKVHWDNIKEATGDNNHPARYALVEAVNIHDPANLILPIHRQIFNADYTQLIEYLKDNLKDKNVDFTLSDGHKESDSNILIFSGDNKATLEIKGLNNSDIIDSVEQVLEAYIKNHPTSEIDYIHGDDEIKDHSENPNNIGFLFPAIGKDEIFQIIAENGVLAKKSFSVGHGQDKRYYMEARKITK